jgi:hypothetical protein
MISRMEGERRAKAKKVKKKGKKQNKTKNRAEEINRERWCTNQQ